MQNYEKVLKILLLHLKKITPLKYFNLYQHLSYLSGALGKTRFSELREKILSYVKIWAQFDKNLS